jgi:hypothetical protein
LYVCKRDKKGRPVMVMNFEKIVYHAPQTEDLISMCIYLFTFVVEKLMIPGLVENWIMIVDLSNVGLT